VERLKVQALSSNSSTTKKKKNFFWQGFAMYSRLALNSLCSLAGLGLMTLLLCLPSAEITDVCHHTQKYSLRI
jgi:hypothetical protein